MSADQTIKLTDSQRAYLRLVFAHKSSKEIAQSLGISAHTVDKRIKEAMRILGVSSRIDAARILAAVEAGQSLDPLGPQSPDLVETHLLGPSSHIGEQGNGSGANTSRNALHDEQSVVGRAMAGDPGFPLPFPTRARPDNDLSILQRAGWMIGLVIGLAVATGILLSGLSALTTLIIALLR